MSHAPAGSGPSRKRWALRNAPAKNLGRQVRSQIWATGASHQPSNDEPLVAPVENGERFPVVAGRSRQVDVARVL
jgi:hypothetical protein